MTGRQRFVLVILFVVVGVVPMAVPIMGFNIGWDNPFSSAPTLPATLVADDSGGPLHFEFVSPIGEHCQTPLWSRHLPAGARAGDQVLVRALTPYYCSNIELVGERSDLNSKLSVLFIPVAGFVLVATRHHRWRQRQSFAGRPVIIGLPTSATLTLAGSTTVSPAPAGPPMVFRVVDPLVILGLLAPIGGAVGAGRLLVGGPEVPIAFPIIAVVLFLWSAYLGYWRLTLRLELDGATLRWRGVLRRGEIDVGDIERIERARTWLDRGDAARFRVRYGPGLIVPLGAGLRELVDALRQRNPGIGVTIEY